jgi:diguanylate cyclase (GGDEF)-like protein/PAS domain S-box-containing protein
MKDVVWILDPITFRFRYVSPSIQGLTGTTPEEVMRGTIDEMLSCDQALILKKKISEKNNLFLAGDRQDRIYREEIQQVCKNGLKIWVEVIAKYYKNDETGQIEIHGVTREITERKLVEERIRHLAYFDTLTRLPNRRMLQDRFYQAMARNKRSGFYSAFFFLDLDNFKPLNDQYGHVAGDLLLVEAARRLSACVGEVDTVARFGGDEFVVMICELDKIRDQAESQAVLIAERIRQVLEEPYLLLTADKQGERTFNHKCTCSIGGVVFSGQETDLDELLKRADAAMYKAKEAGRNEVRFDSFTGAMIGV